MLGGGEGRDILYTTIINTQGETSPTRALPLNQLNEILFGRIL